MTDRGLSGGVMTCKAMLPAIGATVMVRSGALHVACIVHDVKQAYGRARLLIIPVAGEGSEWIEMSRVIERKS